MDSQYQNLVFKSSEIKHQYGENVHLLHSPLMLSYLAKLGHPQTTQPSINALVEILYQYLFDQSAGLFFDQKILEIPTRMETFHQGAAFTGPIIDPDLKVVTVDLARAGTLPSHICYERLNYLIHPQNARQDHFYISRKLNEQGEVIGVDVAGSKIGGGVSDSIILFPDPMGATGSTITEAVKYYKNLSSSFKKMIAMHLIITPEYLQKVTSECPDLKIVALRLDRGLSKSEILHQQPGLNWSSEKGLNEHQYIVPGAGGLGEILNNSYC